MLKFYFFGKKPFFLKKKDLFLHCIKTVKPI